MPRSEIDDIFASKGKLLPATSKASSSSSLADDQKKKKKKKTKDAKRKREETDEDPAPSKPPKRKVPETVFDPSVALPSVKKSTSSRVEKSGPNAGNPKKPKKDREEEGRFKDSRGTGPRRETEEGYAIYKEDELGITDQGGDTPLCPFDCQCCF